MRPTVGLEGLRMLNDESGRQAGIARLISDLPTAKVELLSAQCVPTVFASNILSRNLFLLVNPRR